MGTANALRIQAKLRLKQAHRLRARPLSDIELAQDAVVFAPHPDDETLGCGGTIVRKRRVGAEVTIAFMTDGSRSHEAFIAPDKLALVRRNEAVRACAALGVDSAHMEWVAFRDGALAQNERAAIASVRAILRARRPAQVFVPYRGDDHPDHVATRDIVLSALEGRITILEYPVWFLHHWPWVAPPARGRRESLRAIAGLGLRYLADFNVRVALDDVSAIKRAALAAHVSQTVRPVGTPGWQTLEDISGGEFLAGFFEAEVFRRSECGLRS